MAAASAGTSLEYTPTWALATVCFFFISVSILLEHLIFLLVSWLKRHKKTALTDAVEKLKAELMLLGFVSLLLAVTQDRIAKICIPEKLGNIMLPCRKYVNETTEVETVEHYVNKFAGNLNSSSAHVMFEEMLRRTQRILAEEEAEAVEDYCGDVYETNLQGKVSLVTKNALHQLHLLIFALAVMHIVYSVLTMALGRAKMRRWESWEEETRTMEYQVANDPNRFRLTRQTTFGKRHMNSCTETSFHLWLKCFFRQFYNSVAKVDYFTMRHGFISAHLSNRHNNFDFQKYIQRSLEEDFKTLVGISPAMWFAVAIFMLVDVYGWHVYLWLSYVPLLVVLVLGTKLEYIVAKMALQIKEQNNVIIGTPLVRVNDDLFWFKKPRFVLILLHYTLFLNAFELAFFVWVTAQFGFKSCYHEHTVIIVTRIFLAVTTQVLCSYITLPLYALVTQMGSQFKGKILEDNMAGILKQWHGDVRRKRRKEERESQSARTSFSVEWSSMRNSISSYMRPSPSRRGENADFSNRWDNKEQIVELEESSSSRGQIRSAIDNLWFHQTILFPEPISLLGPKSTETPQDSTANSSFTYPNSSSMVSLVVADEEVSSNFSTMLEPEIPSPGSTDSPEMSTPQDYDTKRPTRLDIVANRLMLIRSQSSSPISNDRRSSPRKSRTSSGLLTRKLEKSMSMRSLGELELEEVKGLMDLGFTFKKENLNPRMMSLVPGLQRLGVGRHRHSKKRKNSSDDDDDVVEVVAAKDDGGGDEEVEVARPYLSEAWLIKRPDSPLLNLRLPTRVSSAADMKKHLKSWARTVASEIQQES
ncbi:hypothetical protein ACLB2K_063888 [Fragaria x ananassa]